MTSKSTSRHERAIDEASELLRTTLLAKLAVDLGDPVLARRAARYAAGHARLLSDLDFPAQVEHFERADLPAVDDLLGRLYVSRPGAEGGGGRPREDHGHLYDPAVVPNLPRRSDGAAPGEDA